MAELSEDLLAGRYQIGGLLGRGGMAEVRAAHDERLDREVAVKILRPELAADEAVHQRFEAEARTAARLSHPNVVNVFDAGTDGDRVYMVMERLPGTTLENEMGAGPMSVARVVDIGRQVAGGLAAAHLAGIVHRDIKPGNVLTVPDGTVKLADFGIATVMGSASLTATGLVVGTPAYLAPERATGQSATLRSDVYSVGALLYACLAGRRPYEADSAVALMVAMQSRAPTPIEEIRPDVPAALVAVIERAMAVSPEERFPGAAEMAAALAGIPVEAPAGPATAVVAGADTTSVMAAAGMASAAGIGGTVVAGPPPGGVGPVMAPPGEGAGWRRATILLVGLALLILAGGLAYGLTKGIGSNSGPASTTTSSPGTSSTTSPSSTPSTTTTSSTSTSTTETSSTTTSTTEPTTTVTVTVPGSSGSTTSPPSTSPGGTG